CTLFTLDILYAHLDPHSFPTRRSSDLCMKYRRRCRKHLFRFAKVMCLETRLSMRRNFMNFVPDFIRKLRLRMFVTRHMKLSCWQDRKSTRLNSSHVSISYAVFCLKKKN